MSTAAIVVMVIGMVVIWGGLVASIVNARRASGDGMGTVAEDPPPADPSASPDR